MNTFAVLLRGVNVGGKNKVSMTELKSYLEKLGFSNVTTYIASGNVILQTDKTAEEVKAQIEEMLPLYFKLDSELIKVLILTPDQIQAIIDNKPIGFGEKPDKYHNDAIFLMGINESEAMQVFNPREGVDTIWLGDGVIYSQRLSELRTKSRLNKIISTHAYKSMTIRTWSTVTKLQEIFKDIQSR
jgi:uncharacterized protein (DUF1697 family)